METVPDPTHPSCFAQSVWDGAENADSREVPGLDAGRLMFEVQCPSDVPGSMRFARQRGESEGATKRGSDKARERQKRGCDKSELSEQNNGERARERQSEGAT